MRRHFEEQLAECNERLLSMGVLAQRMFSESVRFLLEGDQEASRDVHACEDQVNSLHIEIDERVITALALQHPVAADLRLLVMASKIAGELERVGDQAVNICQQAASFTRPPGEIASEVRSMAEPVRSMLRESLDAFVRRDVELAQRVLDTDDDVDAFKDRISFQLLGRMTAERAEIPNALALILVSRSLERVADHATNIAEEVIYVAQGRDVRHHHERTRRAEDPERNGQS